MNTFLSPPTSCRKSSMLLAVCAVLFAVFADKAAIAAEPTGRIQPSLIRLRENKLKGTQYDCRLIASLEGRGNMDGFRVVEGGAHFFYQTELEWHVDILENDGVTLVERRRFKTSAGTAMLSVTDFGLTSKAAGIASGGAAAFVTAAGAPLTAGWVSFAVGSLSRSDTLLKVPLVGPYLRSKIKNMADAYGPNQALRMATKTLGNLKGTELVLTWKNGKLDSYRVITPGVVLTRESIAWATRAAAYLDANFFPDTDRRVGESWVVAAKDVADYFNAEPELTDSTEGTLMINRVPDEVPGQIAVLNGKGAVSYSGEKYAAECSVTAINAKFRYEKVGAGRNQFLSDFNTTGIATINKMEAGSMLSGLRITTQPTYTVVYTCDQK